MHGTLPLMAPPPFAGLPCAYFSAILADPPWRFATRSEKGRDRCPDAPVTRADSRNNRPERHYRTMPLDEIMALPIPYVAAADCVLFLWAVDPLLPQAFEVGRAWGFSYKTVAFYWAKERRKNSKRGRNQTEPDKIQFPMGTGYWTRPNPEQCLLFTRGEPKRRSASVRKLIVAPRREHSRKPDEARDRIERLVAGPYLELFARTERPGWTAWGDQVGRFAA